MRGGLELVATDGLETIGLPADVDAITLTATTADGTALRQLEAN